MMNVQDFAARGHVGRNAIPPYVYTGFLKRYRCGISCGDRDYRDRLRRPPWLQAT
jgi:hypothetical protein